MISLMFGLFIGAMALILQLALWIIQTCFVLGLELCTIAVEFIINTIGACFGATGTSISSRKATEKSLLLNTFRIEIRIEGSVRENVGKLKRK